MKKLYKCPTCKSDKLLLRDFSTGVSQLKLFGENIEVEGYNEHPEAEKKIKVDVCADCGNVYCHEALV